MNKISKCSQECQVIIVPQDLKFEDYVRVMGNLDKPHFEASLYKTFLNTLSQMNHIRANYGIERELERYYQRTIAK